jgi:hypothetical protein
MAVTPTKAAAKAVTVHVPPRGVDNLAAVQKVVANTLGRLGCGGCLSGFDIRLTQLNDLIVDPRSFDVKEQFG